MTGIINALNQEYDDIMPLTASRGRVHDYLSLVFNYSEPRRVIIQMYQYIAGVIEDAAERCKTGVESATSAPSHLYDVRDPDTVEVYKFSKEMKEEYYSLTVQCLYLSKRARPDLQTSVTFHYTHVLSPDEDDDLKLARTI